jgi:hypothetical protein
MLRLENCARGYSRSAPSLALAQAMWLLTRLPLGFALLLWLPVAVAQSNLGELLDAGAKKLSVDEFKKEVVQRLIVGPTLSGAIVEVMYAPTGLIQGLGSYGAPAPGARAATMSAPVSGDWTVDNEGRICTSMRVGMSLGSGSTLLPTRCQFWFKYKEDYFFTDSDSDRSMRVLRRIVKQ